MLDACYYTFAQTYSMFNTKSEHYHKPWTLDGYDMSMPAHQQ